MLLATSTKFSDIEESVVLPLIMSGFRDCCLAAGTEVRGGQTARNPWVLLGGCATSVLKRNWKIKQKIINFIKSFFLQY